MEDEHAHSGNNYVGLIHYQTNIYQGQHFVRVTSDLLLVAASVAPELVAAALGCLQLSLLLVAASGAPELVAAALGCLLLSLLLVAASGAPELVAVAFSSSGIG